MGVIIRQSFWISVFSYAGVLLGYLNTIFLFPLYLTLDQIGFIKFILSTSMLFLPLVHLGLSQTLLRYFPVIKNKVDDLSGLLPWVMIVASLLFMVFLGSFLLLDEYIIGLFAEKAPEAANYFDLILVLLFIMHIMALLDAYSRSQLQVVIVNVLRDLGLRVFTSLIILGYALDGFDFDTFLQLFVGMYALNVLILIAFLRARKLLYLSLDFSFYKVLNLREVAGYTIFGFLGSTSSSLFRRVDNFMITALSGLTFTGIYATMFNIAMVIEVPMFAIAQISQPLIARSFAEKDMENIGDIYRKSSINQHLIGSLILIGIWANLQSLFDIMPNGEEFREGYWVAVIIGFAKLIDMTSGANNEIINMSKHYRFNLYIMLMMAVFAAFLNWLMIPRFGMEGAAVATLISIFIYNAGKMIFIWRKFRMLPLSLKNLWLALISAAILYLALVIPRLELAWLDIIVRSAGITLVFGVTVLIFRISDEVNQLFFQTLKRFKIHFRP